MIQQFPKRRVFLKKCVKNWMLATILGRERSGHRPVFHVFCFFLKSNGQRFKIHEPPKLTAANIVAITFWSPKMKFES